MKRHICYLSLLAIVLSTAMAFGDSMKVKTVIAFDLDDTLAVTKSPITPKMADRLSQLLDRYEVCVISGGKFEQFKTQVVDKLSVSDTQLSRLHLMPTSGTRYYRYETDRKDWYTVYAEDLTPAQKDQITTVAQAAAQELGLWPSEPYGPVVEDRGSQISMSLLGQNAPAEKKIRMG